MERARPDSRAPARAVKPGLCRSRGSLRWRGFGAGSSPAAARNGGRRPHTIFRCTETIFSCCICRSWQVRLAFSLFRGQPRQREADA